MAVVIADLGWQIYFLQSYNNNTPFAKTDAASEVSESQCAWDKSTRWISVAANGNHLTGASQIGDVAI